MVRGDSDGDLVGEIDGGVDGGTVGGDVGASDIVGRLVGEYEGENVCEHDSISAATPSTSPSSIVHVSHPTVLQLQPRLIACASKNVAYNSLLVCCG